MSENNFTPKEKYKIHSNILSACCVISDMLRETAEAYKVSQQDEYSKVLEAKLYSDSLLKVLKELNGIDG